MNKITFQNPDVLYRYFAPLNSCELVFTYEQFTLLNFCCIDHEIDVIFDVYGNIIKSETIFNRMNIRAYDKNNRKYSCTLIIKDKKLINVIEVIVNQ